MLTQKLRVVGQPRGMGGKMFAKLAQQLQADGQVGKAVCCEVLSLLLMQGYHCLLEHVVRHINGVAK